MARPVARQPWPPERRQEPEADPLLSFSAESNTAGAPSRARSGNTWKWIALTVVIIALAAGGVATVIFFNRDARAADSATVAPPPVVSTGTATINSQPPGAVVVIDGTPRGQTPLKVTLSVGSHTMELQNNGATRSVPLVIEAGTVASHYIDLAAPVSAGRLEVTSEPAGARVLLDGQFRGLTPFVLATITPGLHKVIVANETANVSRGVTITAGATSTVMVTLAAPGVSAGWVSIQSPIELQVLEGGRVIGTTGAERLMLPGGKHDLELVNSTFEFRTTTSVQIANGSTSTTTIAVPNGSLSVNALPWADVTVDGRAVGTTPLANLSVPIGMHEIVWRHPQLGERRQSVAVTAKTPVRVGVELGK